MSKPNRPVQEINNAYFRKVAELGDLHWKVAKFTGQYSEGEMARIESELRELDKEMDRAQAFLLKEQQDAARKTAEEAKSKTEKKPMAAKQAPQEQQADAQP
jgi:hypothetical protein